MCKTKSAWVNPKLGLKVFNVLTGGTSRLEIILEISLNGRFSLRKSMF
jgi:hypothetical protein